MSKSLLTKRDWTCGTCGSEDVCLPDCPVSRYRFGHALTAAKQADAKIAELRETIRELAVHGLPDDLVAVLRDLNVTIPRDHEVKLADGRSLFEHMQEWRNAPSNTASAGGESA